MTANLFLGSLAMLSVVAIVIVSLTRTGDNNRSKDRQSWMRTGKNSGEREEAE